HQTLLAAIDWSYNLLAAAEQTLFHRLSVFSGGWTLEAAETVCDGNGVESVLELLSGLVDKSLVLVEERDGQQRYRFMVALQEYAQKRLADAGGAADVVRRHAEFFLGLALEGESKLLGSEQRTWVERLNADHGNMRAALNWAAKTDVQIGLRLAGALSRFWELRGLWQEGRKWLAEMVGTKDALAHPAQQVQAFNGAARIAEHLGEFDSSRTYADHALSLARKAGDSREAAIALNTLAVVAGKQGDFVQTRSLLEKSLAIRL